MKKYYPCPICGKWVFERPGDYGICLVCGWENDPVQAKAPDFSGGANKMSLNETKKTYTEGGHIR